VKIKAVINLLLPFIGISSITWFGDQQKVLPRHSFVLHF